MNLSSSPLCGTMLSRVLSSSPPDVMSSVVSGIDWSLPDVANAPMPIHSQLWGFEVVYFHALSTIAVLRDETLWRLALEIADRTLLSHTLVKTGEERSQPVDMSDWVRSGVLATVARVGTSQMMSDLMKYLEKRRDLTANLSNSSNPFPCPFKALAQSTDGDYKKKLKMLWTLGRSQQRAGLNAGPSYMKRLDRLVLERLSTRAFDMALLYENKEMMDVVLSSGPGPLGHAACKIESLLIAIGAHKGATVSKCTELLDRVGWNSLDVSKINQAVPQTIRYLSHVSVSCLKVLHPSAPLFESTILRDLSISDPLCEHTSSARLALFLLTKIRDVPNEVKVDCESTVIGQSIKCSHLTFAALSESHVGPAWEVIQTLSSNRKLDPYPDIDGWALLTAIGKTPWNDRLDHALSSLTVTAAKEFLALRATELSKFWSDNKREEDLDLARHLNSVERWWSVLPRASLPESTPLIWMEKIVEDLPPKIAVGVRRALLSEVANRAQLHAPISSSLPKM